MVDYLEGITASPPEYPDILSAHWLVLYHVCWHIYRGPRLAQLSALAH